jgi:transcriptional regulator GlxA family with amidase domain
VFCVVAQGAKSTLLNGERHLYEPGKYLLVSLDLPLVGQIEEASRKKPFLGLSMVLDFAELSAMMQQMEAPKVSRVLEPSLAIGTMNAGLLDAVTRLAEMLDRPKEIAMLAPLVRREIFCRLLMEDHGGLLRRMVAENGKTQRIAAGLEWLRQNAARPIRMEELARAVNMSPSAMHSWFRAVTSMSPLQFQKQIRLQNARRMMLADDIDAGTASRRVGYESASQFSREYRRLFGAPPMRDIEQLRQHGNVPV